MSKPKLSLGQVHALLDKLENDDAFRALFQADAAAGLAQIGAPVEAAMCIHVTRLASKQALREARKVVANQLLAVGTLKIFCLDASHHTAPAQVFSAGDARFAAA